MHAFKDSMWRGIWKNFVKFFRTTRPRFEIAQHLAVDTRSNKSEYWYVFKGKMGNRLHAPSDVSVAYQTCWSRATRGVQPYLCQCGHGDRWYQPEHARAARVPREDYAARATPSYTVRTLFWSSRLVLLLLCSWPLHLHVHPPLERKKKELAGLVFIFLKDFTLHLDTCIKY